MNDPRSIFSPPLRPFGAALLCLTTLLGIAGCDSSGPVADTFLIEGDLAFGGSEAHTLISDDEGIARFEIVMLRPKLVDVTIPLTLSVGFGLGRPGEEGCETSFRANGAQGSIFSIGLERETEYCILIFDSGSLPEDALIEYLVSVTAG